MECPGGKPQELRPADGKSKDDGFSTPNDGPWRKDISLETGGGRGLGTVCNPILESEQRASHTTTQLYTPLPLFVIPPPSPFPGGFMDKSPLALPSLLSLSPCPCPSLLLSAALRCGTYQSVKSESRISWCGVARACRSPCSFLPRGACVTGSVCVCVCVHGNMRVCDLEP